MDDKLTKQELEEFKAYGIREITAYDVQHYLGYKYEEALSLIGTFPYGRFDGIRLHVYSAHYLRRRGVSHFKEAGQDE